MRTRRIYDTKLHQYKWYEVVSSEDWDEHLFVSVISNLSSQHEQKAAVVPPTLHIMHECQCLNTRFTRDHTQMLGILLQIIVRPRRKSGGREARESGQAGKQAMSLTRQKILKIPPPDGRSRRRRRRRKNGDPNETGLGWNHP